jgi:cell division protein FtsB
MSIFLAHEQPNRSPLNPMANVFGILTAVVLALAAFVAFKNKDAYANELSHRKAAQEKLAVSQKRLEAARATLASTQDERSKTEANVAKLKTEEAAQKKSNDDIKSQIETKKQTVDANKKNLDQIREKTAPLGEIKELAPMVNALRSAIGELKQEIATNEGKLVNLSDENTRVEGGIQVLRNQSDMVSRRESYFTKTQISSIYPNWGFVTLAAGSTAGVVSGSTLEVVRDGSTVAKLLVTAVESNTSSASIVPDSIAQDTVLMVGDQVVAAHKPAPQPVKVAQPEATPAAADPAEKPAADAVPSLESELGADPLAEPAAKPEPAAETKPAAEAEPEL